MSTFEWHLVGTTMIVTAIVLLIWQHFVIREYRHLHTTWDDIMWAVYKKTHKLVRVNETTLIVREID